MSAKNAKSRARRVGSLLALHGLAYSTAIASVRPCLNQIEAPGGLSCSSDPISSAATNIVTISAVKNTLGHRSALIYTLTVGVISYIMGTLVDLFWDDLAGSEPAAHLGHDHLTLLHWCSAAVLGTLMLWHIARKLKQRFQSAK